MHYIYRMNKLCFMTNLKSFFFFLLIISQVATVFGQFRNKPRYEKFEYRVLESPTFEVYHYLENKERLKEMVQWAEQWYEQHQAVMHDSFFYKNPFVLYNNHADFQQTNTISGAIGGGTGGVTEAFKNRVILPIAFTNQQTHHVIGHELVHAFQYHTILNGDSTSLQSMGNLPLWMVEGLAEYMSKGREDTQTAMWMRAVVENDAIPAIRELANPRYFPYRYGQAAWAFLTGLYGDGVIEPLFLATAKYGMQISIPLVLGITEDSLSTLWKQSLIDYYEPLLQGRSKKAPGRRILDDKNAGNLNISPVLSPNGKYLIFNSEKDVFSIDLFLANAHNGKIIRKVASSARGGHIDDFNYIESAGTWSPDSKKVAFVGVSKGNNILIISDVEKGEIVDKVRFDELPAFSNPAWSPDGKSIVVTGLVEGQTDLYMISLKSGKIKQLTNDKYSEIQANWSADGKTLVFASDRLSYPHKRYNGKWKFNITELDLETGNFRDYALFEGADNLNPQYDHEGNIYFLSDRNGFRDLYKYDIQEDQVYQMTNLITGISGITPFAPAISVSRKKDRIVYSLFDINKYHIYKTSSKALSHRAVPRDSMDWTAGILPPGMTPHLDIVSASMANSDSWTPLEDDEFEFIPYKSKFKLDYISPTGVGIGVNTSNTFGNNVGAAGGVSLLFSDIMGNHQLFTGFSLNGDVQDFSGAVQYLNKKSRIAWGGGLSHIPYRTGFQTRPVQTTININGVPTSVFERQTQLLRIFEDRLSLYAQYPLSRTQRFEAQVAGNVRYASGEIISEYFLLDGRFVGSNRDRQDVSNLNLGGLFGSSVVAYVSDNSFTGVTFSPLKGHKLQLSVEKYMGSFDFLSTTMSYRKYAWLKPISLAFRLEHFGRYGRDRGSRDITNRRGLNPIYIGNRFLVKGYDFNTILEIQQNGGALNLTRMLGSKYLVTNFEVRIPFTGPRALSLIPSNAFFSELALFYDGGLAYDSFDDFSAAPVIVGGIEELRTPAYVASVGVSMRVNLFGAMILEPFYAIPLQKEATGRFGLNFWPGW